MYLGPFTEINEYLPCIAVNGYPLRVEIIDIGGMTDNVLYVWDYEAEKWELLARQTLQFKLKAVGELLADWNFMRAMADPV